MYQPLYPHLTKKSTLVDESICYDFLCIYQRIKRSQKACKLVWAVNWCLKLHSFSSLFYMYLKQLFYHGSELVPFCILLTLLLPHHFSECQVAMANNGIPKGTPPSQHPHVGSEFDNPCHSALLLVLKLMYLCG